MTDQAQRPKGNSVIGTIILVIGVMWMALSGLCTAFFAWVSFDMVKARWSDFLSAAPLVFGVGGVSLLIGWLIVVFGRFLRRTARD